MNLLLEGFIDLFTAVLKQTQVTQVVKNDVVESSYSPGVNFIYNLISRLSLNAVKA